MTNNKHTPGPWEADCRAGCFAVRRNGDKLNCMSEASRDSIVFQNGRSEELSEPNGYRYLTDEQIANAHLIAAAPDMLEALESICTEISGGLCMNYTGATGICPNAAKGKCAVWDAIQKAKGTINGD